MDNRTIADRLTSHAHLLARAKSNLYRVRAYRRAAETILRLDEPVEQLVVRDGSQGLLALDGIGRHLAFTIEQLVRTGEFRTLKRKRPAVSHQRSAISADRQTQTAQENVPCLRVCGKSLK